jgi:hypothetical protein
LPEKKVPRIVEFTSSKAVPRRLRTFQPVKGKSFQTSGTATLEHDISEFLASCLADAQHFTDAKFIATTNPNAIVNGQAFSCLSHDRLSPNS